MSKLIGLAFVAMLLLPPANPHTQTFAKYKAITAYEIRPGILVMPRYGTNEEVCEIGLEKLHYSPEMIRLDSGLSRAAIDQIFEELAPTSERDSKSNDLTDNLIAQNGSSLTTITDFEKVTILIYGLASSGARHSVTTDNVVATIK